jgi:ankyrin repeat protein
MGLADAILEKQQQQQQQQGASLPPSVLGLDPPVEEGGESVSWHDDGFSLLHYAARFDLYEVLQTLLMRKGTNVDAVDSRGRTALHMAVLSGGHMCVRKLLKTKGMDVMKVDEAGRTALALAEFKQNAEMGKSGERKRGADKGESSSLGCVLSRFPKSLLATLIIYLSLSLYLAHAHTQTVLLLSKAQASFLYNEAMTIGAVAPYKCKLAVLGKSGSGKTALWRALRGLPCKDGSGRFLRTVLYETSNTSLSALERVEDPQEASREERMLTPHSSDGRQQRGGASSLTGSNHKGEEEMSDDSEYDSSGGSDYNFSSFTAQLIQTLLGIKGRQEHARKISSAFEQHPLASPHLYSQDDAGEVSITCWDIATADAAVPLQPVLLQHADVVLVCFDLVKAILNQADTLRDLIYLFSALDSQEHRPGAPPRAGIVSPARGRGRGEVGQRVFHRRDVFLVGTFLDAVPSIINKGGGREREGKRVVAVLEDLNEAICQSLVSFESFGRLRLPHSLHKPRVFFIVGADDTTAATSIATPNAAIGAAGNEVGSLRRALCKAVMRNGSLRKSRPSMWMRFLEKVRTAGGGAGTEGASGRGGGAGLISLDHARQIANQVCLEFTNRPMAPVMFSLMIKLLGEMGEVLQLPRNDVLLTRPDAILRVYQHLVERCREMELSPRRRSPRASKAGLKSLLQQLRVTGRLRVEDLRLILGKEVAGGNAHQLTLMLILQALETWDLCLRIQTPSSSSSFSFLPPTEEGVFVIFPGIPLALNDELFPFHVEGPEAYASLRGSKVLCYCSFREGRAPQGLLARLLFKGMRPQLRNVGGLLFEHRLWGPPDILARDHVEIPLNGYTLSLTLDESRARVGCAVRCEEGRVLSRALEAQIGLIVYDEIENLRKAFYPRFKMDLLVVDPLVTAVLASSNSNNSSSSDVDTNTGGEKMGSRVYNFVTDILQVHKAIKVSGRATPDASPSSPRSFHFAAATQNEGDGREEEEGSAASYLSRVVHWATVMISAPSSSFHPLPAAMPQTKADAPPSESVASPRRSEIEKGGKGGTWTLQAPLGRLSIFLPGPGQGSRSGILVPHPGGSRRRCKTSAYVCLIAMASVEAATAAAAGCWCLEAVSSEGVEGFRLRWVASSSFSSSSSSSPSSDEALKSSSSEDRGGEMDGWYLGLSSQASEDRNGDTSYVVLNADPSRAAVWFCPPLSTTTTTIFSSPSSLTLNSIGLQWSKCSYRYLTEGAHDVRMPKVRFVVLSEELKQQQHQHQQQQQQQQQLWKAWSFLLLDPSEMERSTLAPLHAACIAGEEEEDGREDGQGVGSERVFTLRVQEPEEDEREGEEIKSSEV